MSVVYFYGHMLGNVDARVFHELEEHPITMDVCMQGARLPWVWEGAVAVKEALLNFSHIFSPPQSSGVSKARVNLVEEPGYPLCILLGHSSVLHTPFPTKEVLHKAGESLIVHQIGQSTPQNFSRTIHSLAIFNLLLLHGVSELGAIRSSSSVWCLGDVLGPSLSSLVLFGFGATAAFLFSSFLYFFTTSLYLKISNLGLF